MRYNFYKSATFLQFLQRLTEKLFSESEITKGHRLKNQKLHIVIADIEKERNFLNIFIASL